MGRVGFWWGSGAESSGIDDDQEDQLGVGVAVGAVPSFSSTGLGASGAPAEQHQDLFVVAF